MRTVLCCCVVFAFSYAQRGYAQGTDPWLVIPAAHERDALWMDPTEVKVRRALQEEGARVWRRSDASASFANKGSRDASVLTDQEIERWQSQSRNGLVLLGRGLYSEALTELDAAHALSPRAIETLSRDARRAATVLDTCLFSVRGLIRTGRRDQAKKRAVECRRLVPRVEPSTRLHPPDVIGVLRSVEGDFGPATTGTVRVTSEPSGCDLRVNGTKFGKTPFVVSELLPSTYTIQVECEADQVGRVRLIRVRAGGTSEVSIDVGRDRRIRTSPMMHLRYQGLRALESKLSDDAQEVLNAIPSSAGVFITMPESRTMLLELVSAESTRNVLAHVRIPSNAVGPTRANVTRAARTLLEGRCIDFTGAEPVEIPGCAPGAEKPVAAQPVAAPPEPVRERGGTWVAGVVLASVGAASLLTGYVLHVFRSSAGDDFVAAPADPVIQEEWLSLRSGLLFAGVGGTVALTAAMPLALPKRDKTPWWAWTAGGLGVASLALSVVFAVSRDEELPGNCADGAANARVCVDRGQKGDRALLLGVTAAPLLTIPLVYLLRPKGSSVTPSVEVSRSRGYFTLSGEF